MNWFTQAAEIITAIAALSMAIALIYEYVWKQKNIWRPRHRFFASIIGGLCILPFLLVNILYIFVVRKTQGLSKDTSWIPNKPVIEYDQMRKHVYFFLFKK